MADVSPTEESPPRRHFRPSGAATIGALILLFWVVIAVAGPLVAPYAEAEFVANESFSRADANLLLGGDYMGRDILSRLIYGARTTLSMGIAATVLSHLLGVSLGFLAAIRGGAVDTILSRLNDALLSFPHIMLGLVVIAALGSSVTILIVTTGIMYASAVFRIARALAVDIMAMDYIEAARARGEGVYWILRREILPNTVPLLLTDFAMRLSFVVLFMSSLSFLGLGIQPPDADWGSMVRENLDGLRAGSLAPIIPAAALASVTVALNLVVDELSIRSGREIAGWRE